jgi:hypothetical protein
MRVRDHTELVTAVENDMSNETLEAPTRIDWMVTGQIVGFTGEGLIPLVTYSRQPGVAAIPARAILDLHRSHIGSDVVLAFENGDPHRPIVMGYFRNEKTWRMPEQAGHVEVDVDGERLVITSREQIVLRCGKASILLRKDGHVEITGETVVSQAVGANHVRGGSVQLN